MIGLLACTGLRISEALALEVGAVDLAQGVILIRVSKYHHSRWVPLHPTALASLRRYDRRRRRLFPEAQYFFVSDRGRRLPSYIFTDFRLRASPPALRKIQWPLVACTKEGHGLLSTVGRRRHVNSEMLRLCIVRNRHRLPARQLANGRRVCVTV